MEMGHSQMLCPPQLAGEGHRDAVPVSAQGLLSELAAEIASGSDLQGLLGDLLHPVVAMTGAQAAAVRMLDTQGQGFHLVAAVGLPPGVVDAERVVDSRCGACGVAVDRAEHVWSVDMGLCAQFAGQSYFGEGCQRMLVVPLRHRGNVLGVYNLYFSSGSEEPSQPLLALLRGMGDLLGLALNNARLEQSHLRAAVMGERQQMAADVHDSVAQAITFIKMRVPLLEDALRAQQRDVALGYCKDLRETASQAHVGLRSVLTQLRAPMDPQGFWHAIDECVRRFRTVSNCELHYVRPLPQFALSPVQETEVFHVVQEALNNVARHAHATHAWLHVHQHPSGEVEMRVDDDGQGIAAHAHHPSHGGTHYGMDIMRERARRMAAHLSVGPREGGGTSVSLRFLPSSPTAAVAEVTR